MVIPKPVLLKIWAKCPKCGSKTVLFDNTANASGIWLKCTRGCGTEFELIVRDGEQRKK